MRASPGLSDGEEADLLGEGDGGALHRGRGRGRGRSTLGDVLCRCGVATVLASMVGQHRRRGDALLFVLAAVHSIALSEQGRESLLRCPDLLALLVDIYRRALGERQPTATLLVALNIVLGSLAVPLPSQSQEKTAALTPLTLTYTADSADSVPESADLTSPSPSPPSSSSWQSPWGPWSAAACEVMVRAVGAALTSSGPGPGPGVGAMKPLLCETFLRALRYLLTAAQAQAEIETEEGGAGGREADVTLTACVDLQCGKIVVLALRGALTSAAPDPSTGIGLLFQALQVDDRERDACMYVCMYVCPILTMDDE